MDIFGLYAHGLVAGSLNHFNIPDAINKALGDKTAYNSGLDYGSQVTAMLLQMTDSPHQGLWGVADFHQQSPLALLLGKHVDPSELNRHVLGRCLDAIHLFGPERLFMLLSKQVLSILGISVEEVHIDSTSFHYDGATRQEKYCLIQAKPGYSRDHRPDLNQFNMLMLVEPRFALPIMAKTISGNINDKISFKDIAANELHWLKRQYHELSYFVGDSAECTADIFNKAREIAIHCVTRIPDNLAVAQLSFTYAKQHPDEFEALEHGPRNDSYSALWVPDDTATLFGHKVKLLVVRNDALNKPKESTIRKDASKEQKKLDQRLKKLRTRPAKCMADAQKNLDELKATCKLTTVVVDEIVPNMGYAHRGAPKKGEEKVVKSVEVHAHAELDEAAISAKIKDSLMFVIATTDIERDWSKQELKATYSRQSCIERDWRLSKNPRFFIDAFYLERPSRINALLWVVSVAMLITLATEQLLNSRCKLHNVEVPNPDGTSRGSTRITFERVRNVFVNHCVSIVALDDLSIRLVGLKGLPQRIVKAMGEEWEQMYDESHIQRVMSRFLSAKGWPI